MEGRILSESGTGPVKKKRVLLTLAKKIEILDSLAAGGTIASVAEQFNVNVSTVRTIRQAEHGIRHSAHYGTATSNKIILASRASSIEMMETKLHEFYVAATAKGLQLTNRKLTEMAIQIFNEVKASGTGTVFMASSTWLSSFKKRFSIQNTAASIGNRGKKFRNNFGKLIEEEGYVPEQVFNIGEDVLFWKRLPTKDHKDHFAKLCILFGCNASGDFMSKPLIVYKDLQRRHQMIHSIPVYARPNIRIGPEEEIKTWYAEYFIPGVQEYLASKRMEFKILVVVDKRSKFKLLADQAIKNVTFRFMPPTAITTLEPLNRGIFSAFKRYYLRRMLSHLSQLLFLNPALKFYQCWNDFNISNCVELIKDAIDEIDSSDINACWQTLWPEALQEFSTPANECVEIEEILQVVNEINDPLCLNVTTKDIADVLNSTEASKNDTNNENSPVEEYLISSDSSSECEIVENPTPVVVQNPAQLPEVILPDDVAVPVIAMPLEKLNAILKASENLEQLVYILDPSLTRSTNFARGLQELLTPYRNQLPP